jgi:hypothetical protein
MHHRNSLAGAGLTLILAVAAHAGTLPADALPLPNRVANAEMIVVGKITSIEDKTVMVAPTPGGKKLEYRIAVITVSEALQAPKGTTKVRLGFVPPPPNVVVSPPPLIPAEGMEGCFFLTKHGEGDFYMAPSPLNFLDKKSANFDKDLALVKRCAKILEDPDAALKGKESEDRFLAASMLVMRYTTRKTPNPKREPIAAEQSKLILEALAAADWTPQKDFTQLSPQMVLGRLALTDKDGWKPPAPGDAKAYAAYAQQWLKDHAATYRIERYVPDAEVKRGEK